MEISAGFAQHRTVKIMMVNYRKVWLFLMGVSLLLPAILRFTPGPSPLHQQFYPIVLVCGLVFIVSCIAAFHAHDIVSGKEAEKKDSSD